LSAVATDIAQATAQPQHKRFRRGTHRTVDPGETLARVRPHMARMGITRLGNITGLDRIGIPVAIAARPNSRSVSLSQGKGLDLPQAMASALMEGCESFHAEKIGPCRHNAYRDLVESETVVDPDTLCPGARPFDPAAAISWIEGYDLLRQQSCWVPAEIVHTDYTGEPDGFFLAGSNGLASGNHLIEAINAAIYELVERDAVALWVAQPLVHRSRCVLELASVDDPDCQRLLARYEIAGVAVRVWNVTTDIRIAAFLCEIGDRSAADPLQLRRYHGSGCHADRAIALSRALTEAAQTRLTYITGLRDDLSPAEYGEEDPDAAIGDALFDALTAEIAVMSFRDVPTFGADDLTEDLQWALDRLRASGIARAIAVDLTRPEFEIPVVRLVIPGLEWDPHHPNYRPGPRARKIAGP
jgi:YcaO-like protein with predicted kinase domain